MLLLINKTSLMGKYVNSTFFNWVAWSTAGVMIVLSVLLVFQ
jgi:Mn2+/Fe2+ NRAMP family transporter